MREMKDSGIEWVGKIPKHWSVMHNKYIMTKKKTIKEIYGGEDIISLSMNGVIIRDLDAGGKMPKTFDGYQIVHPGNLLMCLFDYDVTPRCIGLIKNFGVTSPAYSQFVMNKNNHSGYYNYYYLMVDHTKALLHLAKNLRHSFTEEQLGSISAPVPPVEEQIEIEKFLDQKCSEIDAISSNIQKQIAILEDYKKSVITEAVTKGLNPDVEMKDSGIEWIGEIPRNCKINKLKYVAIISPKCEKFQNLKGNYELTFTPMESIKNGYFINESKHITELTSSLTRYQEGDIALAKVTPCFENGNICIMENLVNKVGMGSSELYIIRSKNIVIKRYLLYWLQNIKFMNEACKTMTGVGGLKRVSSVFLNNSEILVFDNQIQQDIVNYLDQKCSEIDSLISDKNKQLEILADYKKSLIYEYVTGKKEVPES